MTTERDQDETAEMPRPAPQVGEELENVDPEKTLVREDWESTVIRRIARRLAEVQSEIETDETRFGWESAGLRRLSRELAAKDMKSHL